MNNLVTLLETVHLEEQEKENKEEMGEDTKPEEEEEDKKQDSIKTLVDLGQDMDEEEDNYSE